MSATPSSVKDLLSSGQAKKKKISWEPPSAAHEHVNGTKDQGVDGLIWQVGVSEVTKDKQWFRVPTGSQSDSIIELRKQQAIARA